jgi:hypothetical protein
LFSGQKLSGLDLYFQFAAWLAVALLLEDLFGVAKSRVPVLVLFTGVTCGRMLVVGIELSAEEILGGILAALTWIAAPSLSARVRTIVVTIGFVGAVVLRGLEPFQMSSTSQRFEWIPFFSLMEGSIDSDILAFFAKAFTYGVLTWLFIRAGWRWGIATTAGAVLVLTLSVCQIYLAGRSAEITDAIILLLASGTMMLMHESAS